MGLIASHVFALPHQGRCIFTLDQHHEFEHICCGRSRIAKKRLVFQVLHSHKKNLIIVSLVFLPLQVSGWCCLKVKLHCRVAHEMFYLYHPRTVPPCSPLAVTFSYCCTAGWRAIVLRLLAAVFQCKNKDLLIGLLQRYVTMWLAEKETKE